MWRTSSGNRTLKGHEAALIRASLAYVVDMLEEESLGYADHWGFNIRLFDNLSWQQQLALLADVGEALLHEDIPAPTLSAMNEAAIGALYENVDECLQIEIDSDEPGIGDALDMTYWRRLLLAAFMEHDTSGASRGPEEQLPTANCADIGEWSILLECVQDYVLWDADWLDDDVHMDMDPETSRFVKKSMAIAEDYYTAIAPDPTEADLVKVRARLHTLVAEPASPGT